MRFIFLKKQAAESFPFLILSFTKYVKRKPLYKYQPILLKNEDILQDF